MSFSEPTDFKSLFKIGGSESKSGGRSPGFSSDNKAAEENSKNDFNRSKYLLSDKHLKIMILSGGDQDDSKLEFEWFAIDITGTEITI